MLPLPVSTLSHVLREGNLSLFLRDAKHGCELNMAQQEDFCLLKMVLEEGKNSQIIFYFVEFGQGRKRKSNSPQGTLIIFTFNQQWKNSQVIDGIFLKREGIFVDFLPCQMTKKKKKTKQKPNPKSKLFLYFIFFKICSILYTSVQISNLFSSKFQHLMISIL